MTRPKDQDKTGKPAGRDARLAAALRENLRRRKAQERGRGAEAPDKQGQDSGQKSHPAPGGGQGR